MDDRFRTHLAVDNAYERFGDSAYFVQDTYLYEVYGFLPKDEQIAFIKIHNPPKTISNNTDIELYLVFEWDNQYDKTCASFFIELTHAQHLYHSVEFRRMLIKMLLT